VKKLTLGFGHIIGVLAQPSKERIFITFIIMPLRHTITTHLRDMALLAFPDNCLVCRQSLVSGERDICFACIDALPETGYHALADNPVAQHFWGRLPFVHASAYLYVQDANITQDMIHLLKYKRKHHIGIKLGRLYGHKLREQDSLIRDIDLIAPVPLHANRKRQRGYNQCDYFAQGLSEVLNVPYDPNVMKRVKENISQTKRTRYDRWENVEGIFALAQPAKVKGKHILLVDDVITTGATIESCASALMTGEDVRVSVAMIATAGR
jgi:ComF family protein